ncbi:unnamed protein product [Camellia sinensis]
MVGPWSIMWYLLVLNTLVLRVLVNNMDFSWCPFWVQVHGLPLEKLTKRNGEIIGAKIDRLIHVEAHYEGLLLYNGQPHVEGEAAPWISFKYEKLSDFCFDCGRFGHDRNSCKFVSREEGSKSGYGPHLRTGITHKTGFLVKYYWKKMDELEKSMRPLLRRSGLLKQGLSGKMEDSRDESMTETHGVCTELGIVEATTSAYARPGVCTKKVSVRDGNLKPAQRGPDLPTPI